MKRSTPAIASAALALGLLTTTSAEANPAAGTVVYLADAVIGEILGVGSSLLLGSTLAPTGPSPADLSAESFRQIGAIVTSAVADGWFTDYLSTAQNVSDNARDYHRSQVLETAAVDARSIHEDASSAASQVRGIGLRGVPTYMLMTAIELAFIKERAAIDDARGLASDAANKRFNLKVNAADGLDHLARMQGDWEAQARARYPLYEYAHRIGSNGNYYKKVCFDAPQGRICSDGEWRCSVYTQFCESSVTQHADIAVKRSAQLAGDREKIFGEDFAFRAKLGKLVGFNTFDELAVAFSDQYGVLGGWDVDETPRLVGDVNGDGMDDIVAISRGNGVLLHLANGDANTNGFDAAMVATWEFDDWDASLPRTLADVNGDGMADLIGFAPSGVWIAYSSGTRFGPMRHESTDFGTHYGWSAARHLRTAADVNGDGMADLVGFGDTAVIVQLASGNGFYNARPWISDFTIGQGWTHTGNIRRLADVNADGRADIVGFDDNGVTVALSTGSGFTAPASWHNRYNPANGWQVEVHERRVADVNADGLADLVGFGDSSIIVALSDGTRFGAPTSWGTHMTAAEGWNTTDHVRLMGDFDGDGAAEPIGFGDSSVFTNRARAN